MNLLGCRFSGKTSIANILKKLCIQTIQTDIFVQTIVRCPIQKIVPSSGWLFFRDLESFIISKISNPEEISFLDCGGGIVSSKKNVTLLSAYSNNLWIKTSNKTIYSRLKRCSTTQRPTLSPSIREDEELLISQHIRSEIFEKLVFFRLNGANSNIYNIRTILMLQKKYKLKGRLQFVRRFSRNSL